MKKVYICAVALFVLCASTAFARTDMVADDASVSRFFDRFMNLASYDRFRDFYDDYIDRRDISYENFVKHIKESGTRVEGSAVSRLVGWERKGRKVVVAVDLGIANSGSGDKVRRVRLTLTETGSRLIINSKEVFKVFTGKTRKNRK